MKKQDYKRTYWLVDSSVPIEALPTIFTDAFHLKRTVGWSFDDGGVGPTDNNVEVIGAPDEKHEMYRRWFDENYPGTKVAFIVPEFRLYSPLARAIYITSYFDEPRNYGLHEGIDFAGLLNNEPVEVRAAQFGRIWDVGFAQNGYGIYVVVEHNWFGEKYRTWYGHLSSVHTGLYIGQPVPLGYPLGRTGSTGNSTGVHLHLTLQHVGHGLSGYVVPDVVNPLPFLRAV